MADWIHWVNAGLPHVTGADPDDGVGIDCLVMATKVRRSAGLPMPALDPRWFELAAAGCWPELQAEWQRLYVPCRLEPYAVVLHPQPRGLMGIGVVVDDGALIVHHRRGAQWLPMAVAERIMKPLTFWRPRDAAV
jgi:hypothetical protein